jgi:hypothetical protein
MQGKIVSINIFLVVLKKYQLVMQGSYTLSIVTYKNKIASVSIKTFYFILVYGILLSLHLISTPDNFEPGQIQTYRGQRTAHLFLCR